MKKVLMASAMFTILFGGFAYQQAATQTVELALYDGGGPPLVVKA